MVSLAGLAPVLLAATLSVGGRVDPAPADPVEPAMTPDEAVEPLLGLRMEACDSGGFGSGTCEVSCHVVFNFYTTQCNVTCRSGYYACCSCKTGCHCIIDHDELWPPGLGPDRAL